MYSYKFQFFFFKIIILSHFGLLPAQAAWGWQRFGKLSSAVKLSWFLVYKGYSLSSLHLFFSPSVNISVTECLFSSINT